MSWLVFDYGEVISRRTQAVPLLAERMGAPVEEFEPAYWPARDQYDRGGSDLDYWNAVGAPLGIQVDQALSDELTKIDIEGWLPTDEGTLRLLADLSAAGAQLALLSNAPVSFARVAEHQPWTEHFQHLVFSGDLAVAKPDAEIWAALVRRLGTTPGECLFLDDRQVNIDGARRAGLRAQLWPGAEAVRPLLAEFGV
ncbi:putative hydrolase of the HAD superfamily [Kutzneria viridogrisea]|uniref:Hydrolase of the HAD superfamily n=1 Tax=Kutzneria viridogrisea TaxID=47990 RepID=A0ABR6BRV8_9PSEU|nr:HAD family phosphatase [Kutzneria albida]MBA8929644.1 putative hydrolase of the HAD superfamily [Kutzneria viridogrisea]